MKALINFKSKIPRDLFFEIYGVYHFSTGGSTLHYKTRNAREKWFNILFDSKTRKIDFEIDLRTTN